MKDDLISRQATINAFKSLSEDYVSESKIELILKNLPSAEPKTSNYIDEIAKKLMESGTADSINKMTADELWYFIFILSFLNEANKREEKIIRCKECKYYTPMRHDLKTGICAIHSNNFGDDGFCSDAERI